MAKKRKTRQQKLSAQHRHQDFSQKAAPTISLDSTTLSSTSRPIITTPSRSHTTFEDFSSVKHDLIKTTSITGAIVLVELVLFFLLRP